MAISFFTEGCDFHIHRKQSNLGRNVSFSERYQTCHGQNELAKIGAAYAEYEMMPSYETTFKQGNLYSNMVDQKSPIHHYSPHKHTLYKKAASTHSLEKYGKEGIVHPDRPILNRVGGGIVYDTDWKHHYDQIFVVPGNKKLLNSTTQQKPTISRTNSDPRYSVPKPLPRRDSLRGRTKSVIHSKSTQSSHNPSESTYSDKNRFKNIVVPCKTELSRISNNRANSAPPASPRNFSSSNRFTWWFGSSASNNAPMSLVSNKIIRYVNQLILDNLFNNYGSIVFAQKSLVPINELKREGSKPIT